MRDEEKENNMSESSSIVLGVARVRQFNQNTTTRRA